MESQCIRKVVLFVGLSQFDISWANFCFLEQLGECQREPWDTNKTKIKTYSGYFSIKHISSWMKVFSIVGKWCIFGQEWVRGGGGDQVTLKQNPIKGYMCTVAITLHNLQIRRKLHDFMDFWQQEASCTVLYSCIGRIPLETILFNCVSQTYNDQCL